MITKTVMKIIKIKGSSEEIIRGNNIPVMTNEIIEVTHNIITSLNC